MTSSDYNANRLHQAGITFFTKYFEAIPADQANEKIVSEGVKLIASLDIKTIGEIPNGDPAADRAKRLAQAKQNN